MEVSVGVYETCELRVFLFLTQITEKYLEVRATEELEVVVGGYQPPSESQPVMKAQGNREDRAAGWG